MNIQTLRKKLAGKEIIWVSGGKADDNGRYIPDIEDGVNSSIIFFLKDKMAHVDDGKNVELVPMSEKQYLNLFQTHGYKDEK